MVPSSSPTTFYPEPLESVFRIEVRFFGGISSVIRTLSILGCFLLVGGAGGFLLLWWKDVYWLSTHPALSPHPLRPPSLPQITDVLILFFTQSTKCPNPLLSYHRSMLLGFHLAKSILQNLHSSFLSYLDSELRAGLSTIKEADGTVAMSSSDIGPSNRCV